MKDILDKCLSEHPGVTAYDGIFGGTPHIKDRRFTVGDVLARIYTEGSIAAVAEAYDIPESELKEALAFAQDFIEDAFHRIVTGEQPDAREIALDEAAELVETLPLSGSYRMRDRLAEAVRALKR